MRRWMGVALMSALSVATSCATTPHHEPAPTPRPFVVDRAPINVAIAEASTEAIDVARQTAVARVGALGRLVGERMGARLSQPVRDLAWRAPRSLDGLYQQIGADLTDGQPLIIANYYGLWFDFNNNPDKNLNWNTYYGHARMMSRLHRDKHSKKNYEHLDWSLVYESAAEEDPLRTLVYKQIVDPNQAWQDAGVDEPFTVYMVMQAWASREHAARAMTANIRQSVDRELGLDDGSTIDVGKAQITSYFGHNLFYDYEDFEWGGLAAIDGTPTSAKGVSVVGCRTAREPGFPELVGENVYALLFSRDLMASEGYSTLALANGVIERMSSEELVRHANATYRYWHTISDPNKRVGRPFVGHDFKMY